MLLGYLMGGWAGGVAAGVVGCDDAVWGCRLTLPRSLILAGWHGTCGVGRGGTCGWAGRDVAGVVGCVGAVWGRRLYLLGWPAVLLRLPAVAVEVAGCICWVAGCICCLLCGRPAGVLLWCCWAACGWAGRAAAGAVGCVGAVGELLWRGPSGRLPPLGVRPSLLVPLQNSIVAAGIKTLSWASTHIHGQSPTSSSRYSQHAQLRLRRAYGPP